MSDKKEKLLSVTEVAKLLKLSRMTVIRKIKKGEIQARKVGKSYIINADDLSGIFRKISSIEKKGIEKAVRKVLKEYGDIIRRLGKE